MNAATVFISPTDQNVTLASSVAVEVNVSGLGSGGVPSLGVYDLTVSYDPALLSFSSVVWGSGLDILGLGSFQSATPGVGGINLFELSFDLADDLNNLQPDAFRLFTLNFSSLAAGTTAIGITANAIGDADGVELPMTLIDGSVTVSTESPTVPEPATAVHVVLALAVVWCLSRNYGCRRPGRPNLT
ncbi:MAG: hypothetical protein JST93_14790 [Acidobacteria bacterium]|nr:hypothetical protein [Acidobacteriota bacterium]